jgi:hypothetical protein
MKTRLAVLLTCTAVLAIAQQTAVPVAQEPHHHKAFENAFVRVYEVEIPSGEATLLHNHDEPYVGVMLTSTDIRNEVAGKDPAEGHPKDGAVTITKGGFSHVVKTTGAQPFRNLTIELLKTGGKTMADKPADAKEIATGAGWMASTYELAPKQSMVVPNSRKDYLLIALSDLDIKATADNPKNSPIKLARGKTQWMNGGVMENWRNNASSPAKYVVLEMIP